MVDACSADVFDAAARFFQRAPALWRLARPLRDLRDRLVPETAVRQMRDGFKLELRPRGDEYERNMFFSRTYEPATLATFDRLIKPGDTVLDIGANIGLMTLKAATLVGPAGQVIAFEPNPEVYPRLERHVAINGFRNVEVRRHALGSRPGSMPIYVGASNLTNASLLAHEGDRLIAEVPIYRLDDILNDRPVHFIKIDIDGFEAEALKGAAGLLARCRPTILMEFIRAMATPDEDPFAAYDLVMETGLYDCFKFAHSKFSDDATLAPVLGRDDLPEEDNIVFIPKDRAGDLLKA